MTAAETWLKIRRTNISSMEQLADFLQLDATLRARLLSQSPFPLNLPLHIAHKIAKNTLEDPLLRQFVPLVEEGVAVAGFTCDPVQETTYRKAPHLLKKYAARALLIPTEACGMHCRYCFRRHFAYAKGGISLDTELQMIGQDSSISEVILSGGDPLSLTNRQLKDLLVKISAIRHLKRLRFHTRMPIGIPERIDEALLSTLAECPLQVVFVLHCNHVRELDDTVLAALSRMQRIGVPVLCQSVLLKGVNDTEEALFELFETLGNHGILPYYLHQLDPVAGSAHFHVEEARGVSLMQQLQKRVSGYSLPRYVKEVSGEPHKIIIY